MTPRLIANPSQPQISNRLKRSNKLLGGTLNNTEAKRHCAATYPSLGNALFRLAKVAEKVFIMTGPFSEAKEAVMPS